MKSWHVRLFPCDRVLGVISLAMHRINGKFILQDIFVLDGFRVCIDIK